MKTLFKVVSLAMLAAFLALPLAAQSTINFANQASYAGGVYYAPAYNYQTSVFGLGGTSGAYSITVFKPFVTLKDGRQVYPFSTAAPITVGQGSARETVTPSSVANCSSPSNPPGTYCTITATFTNAHGKGDVIVSGDNGLVEARTDASRNGGGLVYFEQDLGPQTLNTGGVTTTTTFLSPTTVFNLGASGLVTTTITGSCTGWSVGISGTTGAYIANNTGLTAGTTAIAVQVAPTKVGTTLGTTAVLITCAGGAASAGAVHAKVWGYTPAQSSF